MESEEGGAKGRKTGHVLTESYLLVVWKRDTGVGVEVGGSCCLQYCGSGREQGLISQMAKMRILEKYRKKGGNVYSQPCGKIYGIAYIFL